MIRLLIVEDRLSVRKGLQMLLAVETDLSVIGEASDGESALALAASLHPDIVLIDIDVPRLNAIATAHSLHQIYPQAGVIMLGFYDDARIRADAAEAGVAAFVAKSMPATALLASIRQVSQMCRARPQTG